MNVCWYLVQNLSLLVSYVKSVNIKICEVIMCLLFYIVTKSTGGLGGGGVLCLTYGFTNNYVLGCSSLQLQVLLVLSSA